MFTMFGTFFNNIQNTQPFAMFAMFSPGRGHPAFPDLKGVFCPHFVKRHIHQSPGASSNYLSRNWGPMFQPHFTPEVGYPAW
jgi:hypothetical protein